MNDTKETRSITVAIWWPREQAYGAGHPCPDMQAAEAYARHDSEIGFGTPQSKSEIHIIETVRTVRIYKP
jgi:hypothetical protein